MQLIINGLAGIGLACVLCVFALVALACLGMFYAYIEDIGPPCHDEEDPP